jgi:hypothetical protein
MKLRPEIVILVIFIFLVCGCTTTDDGITRTSTPQGVAVSFIPSYPEDVTSPDDEITLGVNLQNNADISINGKLCARGILMGYGGFVEKQCSDFNLAGVVLRSDKKTVKDSKEIRFMSEGYRMSDVNTIEPTFLAEATYGCAFVTGPQMCVTSLTTNDDPNAKCSKKESITGTKLKSLSAPITLTKVDKELTISGDGNVNMKVALILKKANDGGYVVNSLDDPETSIGAVKVDVSYGTYGTMTCDSLRNGLLEWRKKESDKLIKCGILLGNVGELGEQKLNVNLNYYYRVEQQKRITVKNYVSGEGNGGGGDGGW